MQPAHLTPSQPVETGHDDQPLWREMGSDGLGGGTVGAQSEAAVVYAAILPVVAARISTTRGLPRATPRASGHFECTPRDARRLHRVDDASQSASPRPARGGSDPSFSFPRLRLAQANRLRPREPSTARRPHRLGSQQAERPPLPTWQGTETGGAILSSGSALRATLAPSEIPPRSAPERG